MSAFSTETTDRDRQHRAAGGAVRRKLSHEELVQRLMNASEEAKAATKRDTKSILGAPDDLVAKALSVANRAI